MCECVRPLTTCVCVRAPSLPVCVCAPPHYLCVCVCPPSHYLCVCVCVGCLLTTVLLMQSLDPLKYSSQVKHMTTSLTQVDPLRKAYYTHLCEHTPARLCS